MRAPTHRSIALVAAIALVGCAAVADPTQSESQKRPFTDTFDIDGCTFVTDDTAGSTGNALFPLVPGQRRILEGDEGDAEIYLQITTCYDDGSNCSTLDGTPVPGVYHIAALGIDTRVLEEREYEDGELIEISHNWFARCAENNAVFYFGEAVQIIEDGEVVDSAGAWEAGVDDARAGVVMPGLFLLGSRYFQEVAPGVAADRAENIAADEDVELELDGIPTVLEGCAVVFETSDLTSADRSGKTYCPGYGLVVDDAAELTGANF